ncbi:MAG: ornithine cyclodeaminase family protein [Gemmatimonadales bacterium]
MTTHAPAVRILSRRMVSELLDLPGCIEVVERAFRMLGDETAAPPVAVGLHVGSGGFHFKAGVFAGERGRYFVGKTNGNFPDNPQAHGLPTIQGAILVSDADRGSPLAVMDSIEITAQRTAAATAVAARYLARADAAVVGIVGCGVQGDRHLRALALMRPLARAVVFDRDAGQAIRFAERMSAALGMPVTAVESIARVAESADVCVTCTPSKEFLLAAGAVRPGCFVAGVGVDATHKRELAPSLLAGGKVVVDWLPQCVAFGDLHHAIEAGVMTAGQVHAELGQIVAGLAPGRESEVEVTVFDSTGMALQDAAAAALVYERAVERRLGLEVSLSD